MSTNTPTGSSDFPNPEYHKIKLEVLLAEMNEALERTHMDEPKSRIIVLEKIVRKHTRTLAHYGNPLIMKSVPENLH
jgi:hypothetical protein